MECHDCAKKEAVHIAFDTDKLDFFKLCEDCIGDDDRIVPANWYTLL